MLLRFEQTRRQPHPWYQIKDLSTTEPIGLADAENLARPMLTLNGVDYEIDIPGRKECSPDGVKREVSPVYREGNEAGKIEIGFVKTKKVLLFNFGYDYRRLILDGALLTAYEVGIGENAHYWCIYRDDLVLAAMIQKDDFVKNTLDTYTLYLEDDSLPDAVCLLTLFLDCTEYANLEDVNGIHVTKTETITVQKELLAKYDPNFIPRICARDGFSER